MAYKNFALVVMCLSYTFLHAGDKIPESAQSNFKLGQFAVFIGQHKGPFASAPARIFGLEYSEEKNNNPKIVVEFLENKNSKGQPIHGGLYDPTQFSKLYTSIKGLSPYLQHDPVHVASRKAVAKVFGVYYFSDGGVRHCLRFVAGKLENKIGCGWPKEDIRLIRAVEKGPLMSESYATVDNDSNDVYMVVGELSEYEIVVKNIDNENDVIAVKKEKVHPIRTTNPIPLELPSDAPAPTPPPDKKSDSPEEIIEPTQNNFSPI